MRSTVNGLKLNPESLDQFRKTKEPTHSQIFERLDELGYLSFFEDVDDVITLATYALEAFQKFMGLRPDGEFGPISERYLFQQRFCCYPDIMKIGDQQPKWADPNVPIFPRLLLPTLERDMIIEAFHEICNSWNEVCGINLSVVDNARYAGIISDSGRGRENHLDGRGGTLAWAELPTQPNRTLQQMYDLDEQWTYQRLIKIGNHETGHSIGLSHLEAGSLMAPIESDIIRPQEQDAAAAQQLYGKPKDAKNFPVPAEPFPTPNVDKDYINYNDPVLVHFERVEIGDTTDQHT